MVSKRSATFPQCIAVHRNAPQRTATICKPSITFTQCNATHRNAPQWSISVSQRLRNAPQWTASLPRRLHNATHAPQGTAMLRKSTTGQSQVLACARLLYHPEIFYNVFVMCLHYCKGVWYVMHSTAACATCTAVHCNIW